MSFKDHFSTQSAAYAQFRPRYPAALFDWLATQAPSRQRALDLATGSGQAAVELAGRFERVVATDASAKQLLQAEQRSNIDYRCEPAEQISLGDGSCDLVTVAQALHWFDVPKFSAELGRVLRPGGVAAVWCYETFRLEPGIDEICSRFYHETVGPFWPPERRWLETGYAGLELPFPDIETPAFDLAVDWDLDQLIGYLGTWSATQRYREAKGNDPLPAVRESLLRQWGDPVETRYVSWPLKLRVVRKPA